LSGIKKLGAQTLWYGVPTIFTRFLSYAIAILALRYPPLENNNYNLIYSILPFLNVLYVYGLETSYFRFTSLEDKKKVYNTLSVSIFISTSILTILFFFARNTIVETFNIKAHPEYVTWMLGILLLDTLAVLPFCKLREEGRPKKFAAIRVINIVLNISIVLFFTIFCEKLYKNNPNSFWLKWYNPDIRVGYLILGNLIASLVTVLMLYKEILAVRIQLDGALWKKVMRYSLPLIIVGFGGMVNEMLSRVLFERFSTLPETEAKIANSIFAANFKLAVLVTIFIQIFKMAAEPFFFKKANDVDAKKTYARVMKFFVIVCCYIFLVVALFTNLWKYLIAYKHTEYAEGIVVVPILALGYIFLGIYYNLSVWYKLTNKNNYGAVITIMGVLITIVLNIILVPYFGYIGSAWATFCCYAYMMVISFFQGQRHYRIPYAWKKLLAYIIISVLLFAVQRFCYWIFPSTIVYFLAAFLGFAFFTWLIVNVERKELVKIPYLNKFIKQ
jgi:O-antigen/teichoic acid export membrane protein